MKDTNQRQGMSSSDLQDTIAAVATPLGTGGIAVVRLSGPQAVAVADRVFRPGKKGRSLATTPSHRIVYGWVEDPETRRVVDEVLASVMRAPRSYTGEDVVEFSGHGGVVAVQELLKCVLSAGARLALPGEFTRRAFLNGRMDLTQAEAVLDIIEARTPQALNAGVRQLSGELKDFVEEIRTPLMEVYAVLEAMINFPEDDVEEQTKDRLMRDLASLIERTQAVLRTFDQGRWLAEGVRVALIGRPNVGKSSLLNALVGHDRVIVSPKAGTTRDVIEEAVHKEGVLFRLMDTAGVLSPRDAIEEEAVRRSRQALEEADLVWFLLDASRPLHERDRRLWEQVKHKIAIIVLNKIDRPVRLSARVLEKLRFGEHPVVRISARYGTGIESLWEASRSKLGLLGTGFVEGVMITRQRHYDVLNRLKGHLEQALESLCLDRPVEFISDDIRRGLEAMDALLGRGVTEDLIDQIFSRFCIGK